MASLENSPSGTVEATVDARGDEALAEARKQVVFLQCLVEQRNFDLAQSRAREEQQERLLEQARKDAARATARSDRAEREFGEKVRQVVALEGRLAQAEQARAESQTHAHRLSEELRQQNRRNRMELEREQDDKVALTEMLSEARKRLSSLQSTQERLFGKMIEWHQLARTDDPEAFDLAEFIANLRADVHNLQRSLDRVQQREAELAAVLEQHHIEHPTARVASLISAINGPASESKGAVPGERHDAAPDETAELLRLLPRYFERPMAERLLADLTGETKSVRLRAADRLVSLMGASAAPFLAAAAQVVTRPEERADLVERIGRLADPAAYGVAQAFIDDPDVRVRLSALDACAALLPDARGDAAELPRQALADPDPRVRRRAVVYLIGTTGLDAGPLCVGLLADADATTRRLAYAAMSGTRDPEAALALLDGMLDADPGVRQAAAAAARGVFGIDDARRNRLPESERAEAIAGLRSYLAATMHRLAPEGRLLDGEQLVGLLPEGWRPGEGSRESAAHRERIPFERIRDVLLARLGGCTHAELAAELMVDDRTMAEAIRTHEQAGRIVRRGRRLLLP